MDRAPASHSLNFFRACDKHSGITGTARGFFYGKIPACYLFSRLNHLAHTHAMLGPQIKILGLAAMGQIIQNPHMGIGKIRYVDIVADTGTIGRRIISTKDFDTPALSQCRLQDQRNQVCFRRMVFPDHTAGIGSGRIKIAQGYIPQAIGTAELGQHVFNHQFRLAVDISRRVRHVLRNRRLFRFAIHGCRR